MGHRTTVDDLPPEALAKRLEQAKRVAAQEAEQQIFAAYGVKSRDELDAKLKAAAELAEAEERRQRAQLTEVERLKADLDAANAKIAERDARIQAAEENEQASQAQRKFQEIASKHVDPGMIRLALLELREHILEKAEEDPTAEFTDRDAERFLRQLAQKNAKFAIAPAAPPKRPITTGANPSTTKTPPAGGRPPDGPNMYKGKTALPGHPNSMNAQELKEFAKLKGLRTSFGR